MREAEAKRLLPNRLRLYIGLIAVAGAGWLAYLVLGVDWDLSTGAEMGLFVLLIVGAGSFPLHMSPGLKADVTTAVLFCGALLLEPGVAALAGVVGIVSYNLLNGHWGERLRLPWYKYPFNAGQTALFVGATSVVFGALTTGEGVLTPVVVPPAAVMYLANTILVSGAVGLQVGVNPLRVCWSGTMENGPAELGQLAFGFLGAVAYRESPWMIVALFIPVAVIYLAFSRLARANVELKRTLQEMESLQGRIVSTSKLASVGAISLDLAHQIKNPPGRRVGQAGGAPGLRRRTEPGEARSGPGHRGRLAHTGAGADLLVYRAAEVGGARYTGAHGRSRGHSEASPPHPRRNQEGLPGYSAERKR